MRWKVRKRRPSWRRWFAWRPVIARTAQLGDPAGTWIWLELIERRYQKEGDERWTYRTRGGWKPKTWGVPRL